MATEKDALGDQFDLGKSFAVQNMAVANRHTVVLSAMGPDFRTSRIISHSILDDTWGWTHFKFGGWWNIGAGIDGDGCRRVLFGHGGAVAAFNYTRGSNGRESARLKKPATIDAITWIHGHFYACGGNAFLGRRNRSDDWTYFSLHEDAKISKFDYDQIAGLADNDIYLLQAQDRTSLHHWDGTEIRSIALPGAAQSEGLRPVFILAAPTGQIFIVGAEGEVFCGNAKLGFTQLLTSDAKNRAISGTIDNLTWYNDSLWCVAGGRLLRFVDDRWAHQPVYLDHQRATGFTFIDARDGALLLGSQYSAGLFDGTTWHRVFGSADMAEWETKHFL